MCAILDANVVHEVFGRNRSEAGKKFFDWIMERSGRLIVSGKLREELNKTPFRKWMREALRTGFLKREYESAVEARTRELRREGEYSDPHVLALAQVSGARLLYSNDAALQKDFKSKHLIDKPRGKVYSTLESKSFQCAHERLLANKNLCSPEK